MPDYGERRCTAKSRRTGEQCKRSAAVGRKVCSMHGGKSPMAGPSHPAYRTGRYSKILPDARRRFYELSINSPDQLEQSSEVAILQDRLQELLSQVGDVGESAKAWESAARLYAEWQAALGRISERQAANDAAGAEHYGRQAAELSAQLGAVLSDGAKASERWAEIRSTMEQHRKVIESERRRLVETSQTMHVSQLSVMFDVLFGVIADEVFDPDMLQRIADGFDRVIGRPHSAKAARAGERTAGADGAE